MKNSKKKYSMYAIISLAIIFLITSSLLLIGVWDQKQGKFKTHGVQEEVISYEGQKYVLKDNIETFLLIGLDKFDGATVADSHKSGVQADFLMLFVFDNDTKKSTAIQINRDTITEINKLGIGGVKVDSFNTQIALAYNYADDNDKVKCRNTKDAVENLFYGIKANHYLSLTMDAVTTMNDLVGGVEVKVLDDFSGIDDTLIKDEKVTLTGEQALKYVRTRYGLEDSANNTRMVRQQQYINALYDKTKSCLQADDTFLIKLINEMDEYVVYDSSDEKMQAMLNKYKEYDFTGIRQIDGETKMEKEFVEFYPDEDAIWQLVVELFYKKK